MKKLVFTFLSLFPLLGIAQQQYKVTLRVVGGKPNAKAYLYYRKENKIYRDSASLNVDKFEFQGNVESPLKAVVAMSPIGRPIVNVDMADKISFFLEKGSTQIESRDSLLKNARLSGSPVNKLQQELNDALASVSNNNRLYKSAQEEFISKNTESIVSLNLLRTQVNPASDPERAQQLFNKISGKLKNSFEGKNYQSLINAAMAVSIGHSAPAFSSKNPNDKSISLESYRGKYVLLDFWASWCKPCRQENPNLLSAYQKYRTKDFSILGVSLDAGNNGRKAWIDAIEKDGLLWEQVSDLDGGDGKIPRLYMVSIIPSNFLIDPSGKIIAKNLRGKALEQKLSEIFDSSR